MRAKRLVIASALLLGVSAASEAQTRAARPDVSATVGWMTSESGAPSPGAYSYHEWDTTLFGSVGGGWHWTEHLKTEIDFGAGTQGNAYLSRTEFHNGLRVSRNTRREFSRMLVGVSQQYQFYRNAWFHPHIGAGANLTWETYKDLHEPYFVFDPVTRISQYVRPTPEVDPERTDFRVRPFVAAGFKAYMTRRAFFRSDLRVGFKNGIDETVIRFGFGADF